MCKCGFYKYNSLAIKKEKQNIKWQDEIQNIEELITVANEFEKETSLRPFTVDDKKKNIFAEAIKNETRKELFANFAPTLDVIRTIIEHSDEEALV